jgi:proline iminopeptidase
MLAAKFNKRIFAINGGSNLRTSCTTDGAYLSVPGGRVWYEIVGAGKKGVPLLILHGGPGFPHDYLRPLEDLAADRPVIFYDQLGCGRSDRPDNLDFWTVDHFVEELSLIRKELNLDTIHLLGHSWGTMLAVDYALRESVGLLSIVLSSPPLSIKRWLEDADRNRSKLPKNVQDTLKKHERDGTVETEEYKEADRIYASNFICRLSLTPEEVQRSIEGMGEIVYRTMWGASESYMKGSRLEHYDREDRLNELSMPVLFTCGRYDEASPEATAAYHAQIPGSEFVVFEKSAHMPHLEERLAFIDAVNNFLLRWDRGQSGK